MFGTRIAISVLMRLVAADPAAAANHIAKVYEWRYQEAITVSKALVGGGSALVLPLLLPLLQPNATAPLSLGGVIVVVISAAVFVGLGVVRMAMARRIHLEFLAAQTLLGQLVEIRPFLKLYEETRM